MQETGNSCEIHSRNSPELVLQPLVNASRNTECNLNTGHTSVYDYVCI